MDFYITPEQYQQAEKIGVDRDTLNRRVRNLAWSIDKAIKTPKRKLQDRSKWTKLAAQNGISYQTFMTRVNNWGWDEKKAATEPIQDRKKRAALLSARNRKYPVSQIKRAEENGIPYATYRSRILRGWETEAACTIPVLTRSEVGKRGKAGKEGKYRPGGEMLCRNV